MSKTEIIKPEDIQRKFLTIRNSQVMLDSNLAEFCGVETKSLDEQVKRNIDRFPTEFCFQLTESEYESLRSQIATFFESGKVKYRKYLLPSQK